MPKIQVISRDEVFEIGDADCAFTLRRLSPDVVREARRRHTRRLEAESPGQFPREETDEAEVDKDILDYVIQDWRGVELTDGSPAPCTRDHKHTLPNAVKAEILAAVGAVNLQGDSLGPLRPLKGSSKEAAPPA
jgi:hypothetical protein